MSIAVVFRLHEHDTRHQRLRSLQAVLLLFFLGYCIACIAEMLGEKTATVQSLAAVRLFEKGQSHHIVIVEDAQLRQHATLSPAVSNQKSQRPARADSINMLMVSGSLFCFTGARENSEEVFQGK